MLDAVLVNDDDDDDDNWDTLMLLSKSLFVFLIGVFEIDTLTSADSSAGGPDSRWNEVLRLEEVVVISGNRSDWLS